MALTASNTASWVIAAKRAWKNGFWLRTVFSMIAFHSMTGSGARLANAALGLTRSDRRSNTAIRLPSRLPIGFMIVLLNHCGCGEATLRVLLVVQQRGQSSAWFIGQE